MSFRRSEWPPNGWPIISRHSIEPPTPCLGDFSRMPLGSTSTSAAAIVVETGNVLESLIVQRRGTRQPYAGCNRHAGNDLDSIAVIGSVLRLCAERRRTSSIARATRSSARSALECRGPRIVISRDNSTRKKPAVCRHNCASLDRGQERPHWLAGVAVVVCTCSALFPCKQGI
jgi:hypothetical protein